MIPRNPRFRLSFVSIAVAIVCAFAFTILLSGQPPQVRIGFPQDWSHRHLVFSNPGTFREAVIGGEFEKWARIASDPRFTFQQMRRMPMASSPRDVSSDSILDWSFSKLRPKRVKLHGDWSVNMGSGAKVGAGMYPAKFSFGTTTASCTDFVVFNTGLAGSGTQATVIGYTNLYKTTCSGTNPAVYWQYNTAFPQGSTTGDGSKVATSVTLSADGSQIAFVQSNSSNVASLVLLKWASNPSLVNLNTGTNNVVPGSYRSGCSAPCMTRITFNGGTNDTNSAPFVDYGNDALYVGDNSGVLHKFTGIFIGTPAEITGGGTNSGWPQTVNSSNRTLTSPVFDAQSGNVFVGSGTGGGGRKLHRIPAGGGSTHIVNSSTLAASGATGVVDAPLVDSAAGTVYVFVNDDNGNNGGSNTAAVYQFTTSFSSGDAGTEQSLGQNSNSGNAYTGAFDNIYFTSSSASSPTGNLYVCGRASGGQTPTLYRLPITNNALGSPVIGPALAGGTTDCSPITEFINGSTDSIFLSVQANNKTASPISCPAGTGCVMAFNVTTTAGFGTGKTTSAVALATGGTSGIVIDNAAAVTGASQVYFSNLGSVACGTGGTGGCAVQASQSGLGN